jgi:MFS family permease
MDEPSQTATTHPAKPRSAWAQTFDALRYRDFRLLWFATVLIAGGVWLQQVTLGWLAYDLTKDPLQVGIILGVRSAPLLLAPLTGTLADRLDRRKMLLVDQSFVAVLVLGFSVVLFLDLQQVWHLYAFAAAFGLLWSINNPVRQTLVATSVPREALMNGVALNSLAFNSMRAIGPALGGVLLVFFGPAVNFLIQGIAFSGVLLLLVRLSPGAGSGDRQKAREQSIAKGLASGFAYVFSHPTTLTTTAVSFVLTLTTLAVVFNQLPVYTAEVLLDTEGGKLGLLLMSMGVGGVLGTLAMARFARFRHKGLQVLFAFAGAALSLAVLSQVDSVPVAMAILVLQQAFTQVVMTSNLTIVQMATSDEMRGRVTGVYQMEIGMMPIGGIAAGAIASIYGVAMAFLVGGTLGLISVVLIALFVPSFRRLKL